jgi:hypothetical protein
MRFHRVADTGLPVSQRLFNVWPHDVLVFSSLRYIVDGDFIKDDAPFSCCNIESARPCVHHDVTSPKAHVNTRPEGTLYTTGCNDALEAYWNKNVISPALWVLSITLVLLVSSGNDDDDDEDDDNDDDDDEEE